MARSENCGDTVGDAGEGCWRRDQPRQLDAVNGSRVPNRVDSAVRVLLEGGRKRSSLPGRSPGNCVDQPTPRVVEFGRFRSCHLNRSYSIAAGSPGTEKGYGVPFAESL
jgi:hypothetical protein